MSLKLNDTRKWKRDKHGVIPDFLVDEAEELEKKIYFCECGNGKYSWAEKCKICFGISDK